MKQTIVGEGLQTEARRTKTRRKCNLVMLGSVHRQRFCCVAMIVVQHVGVKSRLQYGRDIQLSARMRCKGYIRHFICLHVYLFQ